ncbi:MAG: hypothetical protein AAF416_22560 [Pseudomonadota bacterium]
MIRFINIESSASPFKRISGSRNAASIWLNVAARPPLSFRQKKSSLRNLGRMWSMTIRRTLKRDWLVARSKMAQATSSNACV